MAHTDENGAHCNARSRDRPPFGGFRSG